MLTRQQIEAAATNLTGITRHTELRHSPTYSKLLETPIYFKCENFQYTGAFKIRGIYNDLSQQSAQQLTNGVITASIGNHAKGLAAFVVTARHALKNAFIPVVTVIGITTALALGGSVVMERIFTLPGIGNYILDGMLRRDFPVVQSLVLVLATAVIMVNLLVDLSYGWLDPRVRFQ